MNLRPIPVRSATALLVWVVLAAGTLAAQNIRTVTSSDPPGLNITSTGTGVPVGSPETTLTISGTGLDGVVKIIWKVSLTQQLQILPRSVASAQVTGTIPASYLTTAGTIQIAVTDAANNTSNFYPFIIRDKQTITFAPNDVAFGAGPAQLSATATSQLAVSLATTTPLVCTVSGNFLSAVTTGTCTLTANQAGDANYLAAPTVTKSIAVNKGQQVIVFSPISDVPPGTAPFLISASVVSGLPVSFASTTPSVCGVAGATVTVLLIGQCSITASQTGNVNYLAATSVVRSFNVAPTAFVSVTSSATPSVFGRPLALTATVTPASATGTVTFYFGVQVLGRRSLSGGQAVLVSRLLPAGTQPISARYNGDASNGAAFSALTPQTIRANSAPSLTSAITDAQATVTVAVGDFNGDGKTDLAELLPDGQISVSLGNGDGSFQRQGGGGPSASHVVTGEIAAATVTASVFLAPGLIVGDWNGDGKSDLALTSSLGVTVFIGNGDGTVRAGVDYAVTGIVNGHGGLVSADFNRDGVPDLVVRTLTGIGLLTGNGDGTFQGVSIWPLHIGRAVAVAAGDFNGDGAPDVAAIGIDLNGNPSEVNILQGKGDGSFLAPLVMPLVQGSVSVFGLALATGDLNEDGRTDLVVETASNPPGVNNSVNVFLGNGDGTFRLAGSYDSPAQTAANFAIITADFDGDGHLDVIRSASTSVLRGLGDGTLAATADGTLAGGVDITASDFNGDGHTDIIAAGSGGRLVYLGIGPQTIDFPQPVDVGIDVSPFTITATASSGLPVSFASNSTGICGVTGSTVTVLNAGTCSITASQSGNATNTPAPDVTRTFLVKQAAQTINFPQPSAVTFGVAPFGVSATASSGLAVVFSSNTSSVCSVSGTTVSVLGAGGCSITASQPGSANIALAPVVTRVITVNKAAQTITFAQPGNVVFGVLPFDVTASSASGLAVAVSSSTPAVCTTIGKTVTILSAGGCALTAGQSGDGNYLAASAVVRTFTASPASQTITFNPVPGDVAFTGTPAALSATASSGLAVTFSSEMSGVCTVQGNVVNLVATGNCTVTATQAGDNNFAPASETKTFAVTKGANSIIFAQPADTVFGAETFGLSGSASSGLAVSFASTTSSVCSVQSATVTVVGAGICSVTASQAGNGNFNAATSVSRSFNVSKASNTITFAPLGNVAAGALPFALSATATSNLSVTFASTTPAICSVSVATLTVLGSGLCSVTASQAGNIDYLAAADVSRSFTVGKTAQTITFAALADMTFGNPPPGLSASASSGLAVAFVSSTPSVCTASASGVGILTPGFCSITASQAGNAVYDAATPVSRSFTIGQRSQTITFNPLSNVGLGTPPFSVDASASSGLAVTLVSGSGACSASATMVTILSAGTCTLTAQQSGNSIFLAAPSVSQSFQITVPISITTTSLPSGFVNQNYGPAGLGATGGQGTLSWSLTSGNLPPGVSLSSTGVISGKATAAGTFNFTAMVVDTAGTTALFAGSILVQASAGGVLKVTSTSLSDGTAGSPYSDSLGASGGNFPYTWSFISGATPTGISISSSGTVSGNPLSPGVYSFAVQVTDSTGGVASGAIGLTVNAAMLKLLTDSLPSGVQGFDYPQQVLSASGGKSPYTFSITSGSLPPGVSLASGVISGKPVLSGDYPLTLAVKDAANLVASVGVVVNVRSGAADLVVDSGNVSFALGTGAAGMPPPQSVGVQSSQVAVPLNYSISVAPSASWVSVSSGATTPSVVNVALNSQALLLSPGSFSTKITLTCTSPSCSGKSQVIQVALSVAPAAPQLTVQNSLLSFNASPTDPQAQTQPLSIQNTGGGTLTVGSVSCEAAWCSAGGAPGSLSAGPAAQVNVTANPAGLTAGFYRTAVTVVTSAGSTSVPVTLFVASASTMTLAPSGSQFGMQVGGVPGTASGSFGVNISAGTVNWSAQVLPGAAWLTLGTASGSSSPSQPGGVAFSINSAAAALTAQTYYATIRVTSAGAVNSPQDYQVVLNVTAPTDETVPDPQPGGLLFLTTVGSLAVPAAQAVSVHTNSAVSVNYQAAASTESGNWLAVSPAVGTASAASPGQSLVSINAAGLAAGIYHGGVSYATATAAVRTVNVTLVVSGVGLALQSRSASEGLHALAVTAGCTASALAPTQTGLVNNFSAPAAWPTPLSIVLVDNCGSGITNGQVVATFSNGDPPMALPLADNGKALYSGTWTPRGSAAQVTITARATAPGFAAATAQIAGAVVPNAVPSLTPHGEVHAFNPQVGGALAPGTIIAIYGANLSKATGQPTTIPLATSLNGTSVIIGGIAAPLYYVSPTQINAQVPYELDPAKQYQVVVTSGGALATPEAIQLAPATPGLAAFGDAGIIAQHGDGALVSATAPAKPGEYIVMYLVGMGNTDNPVVTGSGSPGDPLARPNSVPVLKLGGSEVPVAFAGLTPGLVGLYQMNFQLPANTPDGNVALTVTQNGVVSNSTILQVHR